MSSVSRIGFIAAFVLALGVAGLAFSLHVSTAQAPLSPAQSNPRDWLMYQRVPSHNAVVARPGFRVSWQTPLGDRINGGFALIGSTLYAVSFDKKLYAIDAASGKILWSSETDDILMSTPVVKDGLVIVGTGHNGFLNPNDASSQVWGRPEGNDALAFAIGDGHLVWKFHTVGENMPSPAITGNTVVFANGDAHAYALDLSSGTLLWQTPLAGAATMASATIDKGLVFVSSCHNAPYYCETRAIDIRNGHTLWNNPNGGNDCSPAVAGGLVFVNGDRDDTIHYHTGGVDVVAAIDERSGKTVWTYGAPSGPYTFPSSNERQIAGTAAQGVLYQPIGNASRVIAFDERTGKILWNLRTWANVKMSPVVLGRHVYFGDTGGVLYNVLQSTGRVVHTSSFLQAFSPAPPIIAGETIFVADGSVVVAWPLSDV